MSKRQRRKYIEAGWNSYRQAVVPKSAGTGQVKETRQAFYAGATILYETIMLMMDEDREPTAGDLRKMDDLRTELLAFGAAFDFEHLDIRTH